MVDCLFGVTKLHVYYSLCFLYQFIPNRGRLCLCCNNTVISEPVPVCRHLYLFPLLYGISISVSEIYAFISCSVYRQLFIFLMLYCISYSCTRHIFLHLVFFICCFLSVAVTVLLVSLHMHLLLYIFVCHRILGRFTSF